MNKHTASWLFVVTIVAVGIVWCVLEMHTENGTTRSSLANEMLYNRQLPSSLPDTIDTSISGDIVLDDTICVNIFAWKPDTIPYLFGKPAVNKIKEYKQVFDKIHEEKSQWWGENKGLSIGQWYIVNDLYSLWNDDDLKKYLKNKELILWRLNQFVPLRLLPAETAIDRYNKLQIQIDSVLNYDAEMGGNAGLMEYYSVETILADVKEAVLIENLFAVCSSSVLQKRIKQEQKAFESYRKAEECIGRDILDQGGSYGWLCTTEIVGECDRMNRNSKESLFYGLLLAKDTISYPYAMIQESTIVAEYKKAEHYWCYDDFALPEELDDTLVYRREVHQKLQRDQCAWVRWMEARRKVSECLNGDTRSMYDKLTYQIERSKLIQLKNRFNAYGLMSNSMISCLLSRDCTDKELEEHNFEKLWAQFY